MLREEVLKSWENCRVGLKQLREQLLEIYGKVDVLIPVVNSSKYSGIICEIIKELDKNTPQPPPQDQNYDGSTIDEVD
jgi:hypothetical protein